MPKMLFASILLVSYVRIVIATDLEASTVTENLWKSVEDNETEITEKYFPTYSAESKEINVRNQNLTFFDDTFWRDHSDVTKIEASHNPLETVAVLRSDSIEEVDLSFCELRWLREGSMREMNRLLRLNVSYNRHLTTVDIASESLHVLDASHCSVSDFYLQTNNLSKIDLSHNRIEKVSDNVFGSNAVLTVLNLSHNDIRDIEEYTFIRMTRLEHIDLSYNNLEGTDWSITLSKSLVHLNLARNKLQSVDVLYLRKAESLNVSNNHIGTLPEDLDRLLPMLRVLDASGNPIRHISELNAPQLLYLDLRDCKIVEISPNAFQTAMLIQLLDLRDNKLLKLDFLASLKNQTAAILDDNPWSCTCNISVTAMVVCRPSNMTFVEFCAFLKASSLDDTWFRELANPAIWAPLLLALVIVVVACIGFGTYKKIKQRRAYMNESYESVPMDLIQNVPEEEQYQTFRMFRAWQSWQRDRQNLRNSTHDAMYTPEVTSPPWTPRYPVSTAERNRLSAKEFAKSPPVK